MSNVIDLSIYRNNIVTRFDGAETPQTYEEFKTWKELRGMIKGLADFLTPKEQDEVEKLYAAGQLGTINMEGVRRYVRYCTEELLPGINKNRIDAGLPELKGAVLGNAIDGDRWMRDNATKGGWAHQTTNKVYTLNARPKPGEWGHLRDAYIREQVKGIMITVTEMLQKGERIPSLELRTGYFTYRDADRLPYGYAYTIRLEVPVVVAGLTLDSLHERTEEICNFAWPLGYQKAEEHDKLLMRTTVESVLDAISHM